MRSIEGSVKLPESSRQAVENFFSENRLYLNGAWLRVDLEDSSDSEGRASVGESSHLRISQFHPLLARASGFFGFRGPC